MVTLSIQFQSCLISLGPSVATIVIVVGLLDIVRVAEVGLADLEHQRLLCRRTHKAACAAEMYPVITSS
jgi:hypothetical protein